MVQRIILGLIEQWLERTLRHISVLPKVDEKNKYGCYSVVLELPSFDPIRIAIIDPMHNLYISTAKHFLKDVWIERGLIIDGDMRPIQRSC